MVLNYFGSCSFIDYRCIKLALVHDMAECIVGDIAPADNVSKAEKHRREEASNYNVGTRPVITWLGGGSYWQFLDLLPGSHETTGRSFARWTQAGDLWTVGGSFYCSLVFADYLRTMELFWKCFHVHLFCRNTRARAAQRPGWSKSLTFWRWSCRLTSTRNWRGHQEDCRSSLTPPTVCLVCCSFL